MDAGPFVETEWQFDTPDLPAVAAVLERGRLAPYRVEDAGSRHLEDVYFDTADWRIYRSRYTARVRAGGDGWVLTLKSMGSASAGLRRRREYEESIDGPALDHLDQAPGPCGHRLRLICGGRGLRRLFTVRTERRLYRVLDGDRPVAEVALDRTAFGDAEADSRGHSLERLEVEVAPGAGEEGAREFVEALRGVVGLRPAKESKFAAGLGRAALKGPEPPPGPWEPAAGMTVAEAVAAILRRQLAALAENEPGTRLGEDPEFLHDFRVAVRRTRAALGLFRREIPSSLAVYRDELRWLGSLTGPVRDLDVYLAEIARVAEDWPAEGTPGIERIAAVLVGERARARRMLVRGLASSRFLALCDGLARELRGPWSDASGSPDLRAVATKVLMRRRRSVRRLARRLRREPGPALYHELRIAAKKLRYAVEFLAPVYGRPFRRYRERVVAVQDLLGRLQDLEVAERMLGDLQARKERELGAAGLAAAEVLRRRHEDERERLRRQFWPVYRRLRGQGWKDVLARCAELEAAPRSS